MWPSTICHLSTRADSCTIYMPSLTCERYTSGCEVILTFWHSWEAWILLCRVPPLLVLHAVQCVAVLKLGCIIFLQKSFTDQLSKSGPVVQVHIMNSHFFLSSLLSEFRINILSLEVWFCSFGTSSWRLSQIPCCSVWSYDLRRTPWKNWLQTEMSQIQILL